jgi:cytochrome c551
MRAALTWASDYDPAPMSRPAKVLLISGASIAVVALATACGTERIGIAQSDPLHQGAVLFSQRCSGCHTLSYAATHGSAANVRTKQFNNGPNFNVRCERPVARVLYAIENGGFSGAIMPQNIVVGDDAIQVAKFVATYAGRQARKIPGATPCTAVQIGTVPQSSPTATTAAPTTTATATPRAAKPSRRTKKKAAHP